MPWQRHPSLAWGPSAMLVGRHGKGTPTPPLQQLGVGMQTPLPPPGMSTPPAPLRAVLDLQISPQRARSWSRLPGREGSCHCTSRQQALAVQPHTRCPHSQPALQERHVLTNRHLPFSTAGLAMPRLPPGKDGSGVAGEAGDAECHQLRCAWGLGKAAGGQNPLLSSLQCSSPHP